MEVFKQIAGFIILVGLFAGACAVAWLYVRRVRRKFREGMPGWVDPNLAAVYRVGAFDVADATPNQDLDSEDENPDDDPGARRPRS